jgi:hypothetical protein
MKRFFLVVGLLTKRDLIENMAELGILVWSIFCFGVTYDTFVWIAVKNSHVLYS